MAPEKENSDGEIVENSECNWLNLKWIFIISCGNSCKS